MAFRADVGADFQAKKSLNCHPYTHWKGVILTVSRKDHKLWPLFAEPGGPPGRAEAGVPAEHAVRGRGTAVLHVRPQGRAARGALHAGQPRGDRQGVSSQFEAQGRQPIVNINAIRSPNRWWRDRTHLPQKPNCDQKSGRE